MSQAVTRVAKNTFYLYAKMGITMFVSLYTTRLVLNALGAEDFGIFSIVGGAIAMLGFLNAAMASATQRFMSFSEGEGDKEKQKKIFNISFVLHLGIGLAMGFILLFAGWFFFHGILNIPPHRVVAAQVVYGSLIISTVFTVMSVPYEAVLNARENMLYYSLVGILEAFLKLGVAFMVVWTAGDKLIWYGVLMAGIPLITLTIMRIYCHKTYEECTIAPQMYWDKRLLVEMRNFAGWNLVGASSGVVYGYGTNLILNFFFGTRLNTANGISGQLNGQLLALTNSLTKAINPVITKFEGGGDRKAMYKATFIACKLSVIGYSILAIPVMAESTIILKLWLKDIPPYTQLFIQLMIVQVLIEQISLPLGTAVSAIGNVKKYNLVNSLILYSSVLILSFLYILQLPPETLRYVAILAAIFQTVYKICFNVKYGNMELSTYMKEVVLPIILILLSSILTVILVIQTVKESTLRVFLSVILSMTALLISSYFIGIKESERRSLKNYIRSKYIKLT